MVQHQRYTNTAEKISSWMPPCLPLAPWTLRGPCAGPCAAGVSSDGLFFMKVPSDPTSPIHGPPSTDPIKPATTSSHSGCLLGCFWMKTRNLSKYSTLPTKITKILQIFEKTLQDRRFYDDLASELHKYRWFYNDVASRLYTYRCVYNDLAPMLYKYRWCFIDLASMFYKYHWFYNE